MKRLLLVFWFCFGCVDYDDYKIELDDVLTLEALPGSISASGADSVTIKAAVPRSVASANRKVKFVVYGGTFYPDGKTEIIEEARFVDKNNLDKTFAIVYVKPPSTLADSVAIRASVLDDKIITSTSFKLTKAFPEKIEVNLSAFSVLATYASEVQVKAKLKRKKGIVSTGTGVEFFILDSKNVDITDMSRFRASSLTSDQNGECVTNYTNGDVLPPGIYQIGARTRSENGDVLSDTVKLEVKLPK